MVTLNDLLFYFLVFCGLAMGAFAIVFGMIRLARSKTSLGSEGIREEFWTTIAAVAYVLLGLGIVTVMIIGILLWQVTGVPYQSR